MEKEYGMCAKKTPTILLHLQHLRHHKFIILRIHGFCDYDAMEWTSLASLATSETDGIKMLFLHWVLPSKKTPFQLKCVPIILPRTDGISYQDLGITTNQLSAASNQGDSRFPWNSMRWSVDNSRRRRRVDPPDLIKRSLCVVKCRPLFHSMMVAISNTTLLLHCCLRALSLHLCIRPQINKNIK